MKFILPIIWVSFMLFVGCNSHEIKGLVPCHGTVTFEGSPISEATVLFLPSGDNVTTRRSAVGTTDASGNFQAMTLKKDDGIFPGEYAVTVTKYVFPEGRETKQVVSHTVIAQNMPQKNLLPEKYAVPTTSGLVLNIPGHGIDNYKIDLKK